MSVERRVKVSAKIVSSTSSRVCQAAAEFAKRQQQQTTDSLGRTEAEENILPLLKFDL